MFTKHVSFSLLDSEDDNKKRENLALKMLEHCAGLPLAIIVLSGLLSSRHRVEEWEKLHKHIKAYIRKGNGILLQQKDCSHSGVDWVLALSYDDLPYHLKLCFLHFAYFPEDFEIKVKELGRIWMAEGILPSNNHDYSLEMTMEDIAYECICELVQRCMVQVGESDLTGRFKTCRVHDLMRDMCLLRAKEENFLRVVDFQNSGDEEINRLLCRSSILAPTNKVRRLGAYLNGNASNDQLLSLLDDIDGCLRSFMCFNMKSICYEKAVRPLFNRFRVLRVLKFENLVPGNAFKMMKLPKEIENLVLLRLLSLRDTYVESIPYSIGNLRYIQTLDLRVKTFVSTDITNKMMWRLARLRHLYLPREYSLRSTKLSLDTLGDLQTLVNISSTYCDLNVLMQLSNLTKLKIFVTKYMDGRFFKKELNSLRSLDIVNSCGSPSLGPFIACFPRICKLRVYGKMAKLPEHDQLSSTLIKLTMQETCLEDDPMPRLGKLPNLRILNLGNMAFEGHPMVCSTGEFQRLEYLSLSGLVFKEWKVEEGTLPRLSFLKIDNCISLKSVPHGLSHVTTLNEMVVQRMSTEFKHKISQGGEDFYKVQHVRSLIFDNYSQVFVNMKEQI